MTSTETRTRLAPSVGAQAKFSRDRGSDWCARRAPW